MSSEDVNASRAGVLSLAELARHFPVVFGPGVVIPLKIGIAEDIVESLGPPISVAAVRRCLGKHTSRRAYLRKIVEGGPRFDLAGSPCGQIDEGAQAIATAALRRPTQELAAADKRAVFLKAFEATGLSISDYARRGHLDEAAVCSDIDRARHERSIRHANQAALVQRLKDSGLSAEQFAEKRGMPLKKLQLIVAKVASRSGPTVAP